MAFSPIVSKIVIDEIVTSGTKCVVNGGIAYSNSVDLNNTQTVFSDELLPIYVNLDITESTTSALNLTVSTAGVPDAGLNLWQIDKPQVSPDADVRISQFSGSAVDAGGTSDITTLTAATAFTGNFNITESSAIANPAQYQISKLNDTTTAPPANGVANYIISGDNNSINLSDFGIYSGTGTYRVDNISVRAIDAEKDDVDDIELCWAATTANMLYWSGWGTQTGSLTVSIEDDLLDYFANNFTDLGGNTYYAIQWFFTGIYQKQNAVGWSQLDQSGGGGFYTTVTESDYHYANATDSTVMTSLDQYLRNDNVCGLSIQWFSGGGHAVTCWGFDYDSSKSPTSKDYYTGVWISDSDNDKPLGRSAPDDTRYCPIVWDSLNSRYTITYQIGEYGWLDQVDGLAKYSSTQDDQTLAAGERMTVTAGNTANRTTISSGGAQTVFGTANITTINGSGSQVVSSGGIASSTTINANAYQYLNASGTANITTINSDGYQVVYSGGIASSSTISSGGYQLISSGGIASSTTVSSGGYQLIYAGGVASTTTINANGYQYVYAGGVVSSSIVNSGGTQRIISGGIANSTTINIFGYQDIFGGEANFTTINSWGHQTVDFGGTASNTIISSYGGQYVRGGVANSTTIGTYGSQTVFAYGVANSTTVNFGGELLVYAGGSAIAFAMSSDGIIRWDFNTVISGTSNGVAIVNGSGKTSYNMYLGEYSSQLVSSGYIANSTTIHNGISGGQYVSSGGVTNFATIMGGSLDVYAGGVASNTTISSGGRLSVSSGGSANVITQQAYAAIIADTGATIIGGTNARVDGHRAFSIVSGIASNFLLSYGGRLTVFTGHSAINTVIAFGGSQYVSSGGEANNTEISFGGGQFVYTGGVANFTTINGTITFDGVQNVSSGGIANYTTINAYGSQCVSLGGTASNTSVYSSGNQYVSSGGLASNTSIYLGGSQAVFFSGTASNTTISSGGRLSVSSGGSVNVITQQTGAAIIADTGATITSGTNARADGFSAFSIVSGIANNFLLANSGNLTVLAGHSAINTVISSGGIQNISSGGLASNTSIYLGGSQLIFFSGMASNTSVYSSGYQYVSSGGVVTSTTIASGGIQTISSSGRAGFTTISSGGNMSVSVGGSATGILTVAGGHVTLANAATVSSLTKMSYVLSTAKTNDVLVTVSAGTLGTSATAYSLNLDNSATGAYILASGTDLTGMSSKIFSVTNDSQSVNVQVGSSYTFADGDILSLSFTNAVTDQLTATFTIDVTPPTVPALLSRTITGNNVAFDWADSTDSASGVKNYLFEYALNNQFSGATQQTLTASDAVATGLVDGVYYWRAKATDNANNASEWVTGDSFTVDITAPSVPATLTQTVTGSSVAFDWADSTDATSGIKQYEYQLDNNGDFLSNEKSGTVSTSDINATGLVDGIYYWRVRTQDNSGNYSDWNNGSNFTVDITAPTVPSGLDRIVTGNNVALDWSDATDATSGVKQYEIQIDDNNVFTSLVNTQTPTASDATATGLADGVYYWRVRTIDNSSNISDWIAGSDFTVDTKPHVSIEATDTTAGESSDNGMFRISRTGDITGGLTVYFNVSGTAVSGSDYTLKSVSTVLTDSVEIAAGQSYVDVTLEIINDNLPEGTESTTLTLSANSTYVLGATTSGTIDITDEDKFTPVVSSQTVASEIVGSGTQSIVNGGFADNTTINTGGIQSISSGGTATTTTINSGGKQILSSGGKVSFTIINSGGDQYVFGDVATSTIINSRGLLHVFSGGVASNTTISSGGWQMVNSGGTANVINQQAGGAIITNTYAKITGGINTRTDGHSSFSIVNGVASNFLLEGVGELDVWAGHSAIDTVFANGGWQTVDSGGVVRNTTISAGGRQYVYGVASNTIISAGGSQKIYDGGSSVQFTIVSGGIISWDFNTVISGTINGVAVTDSGGKTSYNLNIMGFYQSAYQQYVNSGYTANSTTICESGTQRISSGGIANNTTINYGGWQLISSGGNANSTIINSDDGCQIVDKGGVARFTTINYGEQVIWSSGVASNTTVSAGMQFVNSGGVANSTTVNSGGRQAVSAGGVASNTTITFSGGQFVSSGGTASITNISSGGSMYVSSGGQVTGLLTLAGGQITLADASAVSSLTGIQYELASAVVNDILVNVSAGTLGTGATVYSLNLNSTASGDYILASGIELAGMNNKTFSVTNNGQSVDLRVDGSSYTFADGDVLSLNFTDAVTDRVTATFAVETLPPSTPTGFSWTIGNGVVFDWANSTDANGIKQYMFQVDNNSDFLSNESSGHTVTSNATVCGLADGPYYWRVCAQDNSSNWSDWTDGAIFTVATAAPSAPAALTKTVTVSDVAFDWTDSTDANGILRYEFQLDNNNDFLSNESSGYAVISSATASGLADGIYYWRVRTQDNSGNFSNWTAGNNFMVDTTPPTVPVSLIRTITGSSVSFDWSDAIDAISGVKQYNYQIDNNSDFLSNESSGSTATSGKTVSSLADGVYYWRVCTIDNNNNISNWTAGDSFTIDITAPSVPATLTTIVTGNSVALDWADATDATSGIKQYEIQIDDNNDFTSLVNTQTMTASDAAATGLADGVYYWRVRTIDNNNNISDWNTGSSFTIDTKPRVTIEATDAAAGESANDGMFRISRTGDTTNALTVYFNVGGIATAGSDYMLNNGRAMLTDSVVIAAGQSYVDVTLDVIDDDIQEITESAILTLTADSAYVLGATISGTINIIDEDRIVSSQTVTGEVISSGTQSIADSGIANSTTVNTGGYQKISSGGIANSTTINFSGYQYISSGGVASSTIINFGSQVVFAGGTAASTTISSGGSQCVSSGGVANTNTVNGGGQYVFNGGVTSNNTINSRGRQYISSGGVTNSTIINYGSQTVFAGGTATDTTVNSGGSQYVSSGGVAINTIINSGGFEYVLLSGMETGTLTLAGGHVVLNNAASVSNLTMVSYILSTTKISDVLVTVDGGILGTGATTYSLNTTNTATGSYILAVGVDLSGMISKTFSVTNNSQTVNLTVGSSYTFSNGDNLSLNFADSATDQLTAIFTVAPPEITIAATDDTAGEPDDNGTFRISRTGNTNNALTVYFNSSGTAVTGNDYTLKNGNTALTWSVVIAAGQSYVDITLSVIDDALAEIGRESATLTLNTGSGYTLGSSSSGTIDILDDENVTIISSIVSGMIFSSGTQRIVNGGIVNSATIANRCYQNIYSGGTANYTRIFMSGWQYVYSGGVANSTTISGGNQYVSSGGVASSTIINFGSQAVFAVGTAASTTISSGGYQYVSYGGVANLTTITFSGSQLISGGVANSTTISYGTQTVYSGGVASITTINGGSQTVFSGGVANSTIFNSAGGSQLVSSGGVANLTSITVFGSQLIFSGGAANSTTINSGGSQTVSSGGVANSTTINASGLQKVYSGGMINYTTINSSGRQDIFLGVVASNTTINTLGSQNISSGGTANLTTINSLGRQSVWFGGVANSTTINLSGYQGVNGGTANSTTISSRSFQAVFVGGVANSTIIASGGSQYISAGGIANSTTVYYTGIQNIYSGGVVNSTTLNSGYQSVLLGGVANSTIINFIGRQVVSSGGTANLTTIHSLGRQDVWYGGSATNTTISSGGSQTVSSGGSATGTLTVAGGHVTLANAAAVSSLTEMRYELATATVNDALVTVSAGILGTGATAYSLNLNTTFYGAYILASGADLTGMSSKTFSVTNDGQSVNVQVGSSYTFADGDILSLSFNNAATDQLIATFTIDVTPPTVPATLTQTVTGSTVAFDWADGTDAISGVKGYEYQVDNNSDFLSNEKSGTVSSSDVNATGLVDGIYYWRVRTQDNSGNYSDWSNGDNFTVDNAAPTVPSGLGRIVTGNNVSLDWSDATDATSGVKQYEYQMDNNNDFLSNEKSGTVTGSGGTVADVADGAYFWRVRTQDNSGNYSAWTSGINFTVDVTAPAVPASLTTIVTGNNVALDWADGTDATSGVKQYEYQVDNNSDFLSNEKSGTVSTSDVNATGLVDGIYYWRVRTQDNSGNYSDWSNGDNVTVDNVAPTVPSGLDRIVTGNNVALDWSDATDATSGVKQYEYQVDNNSDFLSNEKSGTVSTSDVNATGLADGTYFWRVRTQDNSGNYSDWSNGSNFTVDITAPSVPATLTQIVTGSSVAFDWADSTDATSGIKQYEIQVDDNNDFTSLVNTQTPTASDAVATGLVDGIYYWRVRTQDNSGNYSDWNNGSNFTVDAKPRVSIEATDTTVGEPSDNGMFRISRTGDITGGLTVYFNVIGTAVSGSDYTLKSGSTVLTDSVEIAAGQSYVDVTLEIINDNIPESTESTTLTLGANSTYVLGATTSGTVNITDEDKFTPIVSSQTVTSEEIVSGTQSVRVGGITNNVTINSLGSQNISSGGVANSTTVNKGSQVISFGGIANNATINSGTWQGVSSGGVANNTILNTGWQYLYTGGVASATTVNSAGYQIVSSGGTASGTIVNLNGRQIVSSGGTANATTVNAFGNQNIVAGGIASGTIVNANGLQFISSGGSASGTVVNLNGKIQIYSSGVVSGTTLSGGLQNIYTGGVANVTLVNGGGQYVSGGTANATTVNKGNQVIFYGGIANSAVINSGTWQGVSSGGVVNNTILNTGWQYLYTGGVANSTTVNSAGYQIVFSGGTASGTIVNLNGRQIVSSGGTANATTVNAFGNQNIVAGGIASGTIVNANGLMFISSGGSASGTVVNLNGKIQIYSGGAANGATINAYGVQNLYAAGVANSTLVNSGVQIVFSGGIANSTTVSKGNQIVSSGGVANGAVIKSGTWQGAYSGGVVNNTVLNAGWQYLFAGGMASAASVNSVGYQVISSGGAASSTIVNSGYQIISSGGTANTTTLNAGGSQIIKGLANGVTINTGGVQFISSGGLASGTVANLNGKIYVYSGGTANSTTLAGGIQNIFTGGVVSSTTINSGGQYVSGGTANATTVNKGNQLISSGGIANYAVINSGTWQGVYSGGVANNTILNTGWQYVFTGGIASATTVNSAGYQVISSGGMAKTTTVNSAGYQIIYTGGVASGTIVNLNGKQNVYSGGTANSATVNSGGSAFVSSGGILSGSLTIDGGHVTVAYSDNMQTPTVNFKLAAAQANDAILVIQTGVTGDVSGSTFNLNIDNTATGSYILADGANLLSMSSTTFSVTDNGENVNMQVGTSYTFADGDHLSLSFSDSTRDKLIAAFTNNPPTAPQPIVFNLNAEVAAASTFDNAKIVDGVEQSGWVSLAGNDDDYRFDLASPVTGGTLRLHDLTDGNADLSLYNASGTLLQSSNNTGTLDDSIISNLAAGTYFARVNAVSGNIDYKLDFDQKYVSGMLAS